MNKKLLYTLFLTFIVAVNYPILGRMEQPISIAVNSIDTNSNSGTFIDQRDNRVYKYVKIGNQIWMAENLAYKVDSTGCIAFKNSDGFAKRHGYLYSWETARRVSPEGWHLPTKEEFETLHSFLGASDKGCSRTVFKNFKKHKDYGFNPLNAGYYCEKDNKFYRGNLIPTARHDYFWTASTKVVEDYHKNKVKINYTYMIYYWREIACISSNNDSDGYYYSVRCVKNTPLEHSNK